MIDEVTLTHATFRPPPRRFEAGTPPIAAAIGLGAALDWMQALDWRGHPVTSCALTRRLLGRTGSIAACGCWGPPIPTIGAAWSRSPSRRFSAEEVCRHLDTRGVALRGGHHCAQPLVRAFGVEGAARASLAPYSQAADVEALLEGVEELVRARPGRAHRASRTPAA